MIIVMGTGQVETIQKIQNYCNLSKIDLSDNSFISFYLQRSIN